MSEAGAGREASGCRAGAWCPTVPARSCSPPGTDQQHYADRREDPSGNLSESVVRLTVQSDGSLKPTDFFEPYDASTLDASDLDFGSGSPVALPSQYFGTPAYPDLAVEVGKEGTSTS